MISNSTAAKNLATETLRTVNWDFAGAKTNHSTQGLHPYLAKYILPFKMRDLDVPFGIGLSPLEIIAASGIIHSIESGS